jgi:hypothetical protein
MHSFLDTESPPFLTSRFDLRDSYSPRHRRIDQCIKLCPRVSSMEAYPHSVCALWHGGPRDRTCVEAMREQVSRKIARAPCQKRYDRCWKLRLRGLSEMSWEGEDVWWYK